MSEIEEDQSGQEAFDSLYNFKVVSEGEHVDITSLLSTRNTDYLLKNNEEQVPIEDLKGKIVGFYFAGSWNAYCASFTPLLVEAYNELAPNESLEIVLLCSEDTVDLSEAYFSTMPSSWLAFPFYENFWTTMQTLGALNFPHLVFFSETGEVLTLQGVQIISDYGSAAFPFTRQKIQSFIEEEKRNQTLSSVLATRTRDFLLSPDGGKLFVSELEGKTVGLYFWSRDSSVFTQTLEKAYKELKKEGEDFEVVMIMPPNEFEEDSFKEAIEKVPWLAIPYQDTKLTSLVRYFEISSTPNLTIIGPDGKTLNRNAVDAINDHESLAFPFTPERIAELDEILRAKEASQTLNSLLVSGDRDFVIRKDGSEVVVSSLEGKTILLFFSRLGADDLKVKQKLEHAYNELTASEAEFEVIFVSTDETESYFEMYLEGMPWLALPFGDERGVNLRENLRVREPMVVAIGPSGRTVAKDARKMVRRYGAYGYPFTEEREKEIEDEIEEKRKGWPEKLKHEMHKRHELVLEELVEYKCNLCEEDGESWCYSCSRCYFYLHPRCALGHE